MIRWKIGRIAMKVVQLPTYEGLYDIPKFLTDFEDRVIDPQRLLALDEAFKATPTCWWETHKNRSMGGFSIVG